MGQLMDQALHCWVKHSKNVRVTITNNGNKACLLNGVIQLIFDEKLPTQAYAQISQVLLTIFELLMLSYQDTCSKKSISFDSKKGGRFTTSKPIQLDPANSNSVILNSLLFQTQNHFPWMSPYYRWFWPPTILSYFSFPLVRNSEVQ